MAELKDLTKRSESYSQWYNDLVLKADLAESLAAASALIAEMIAPMVTLVLSLTMSERYCFDIQSFSA